MWRVFLHRDLIRRKTDIKHAWFFYAQTNFPSKNLLLGGTVHKICLLWMFRCADMTLLWKWLKVDVGKSQIYSLIRKWRMSHVPGTCNQILGCISLFVCRLVQRFTVSRAVNIFQKCFWWTFLWIRPRTPGTAWHSSFWYFLFQNLFICFL